MPPAHDHNTATISPRTVTMLEVGSIMLTVMITAWAIVPLRLGNRWLESIPAMLALSLMLHSHWTRGETPRDLGLTHHCFLRALLLLLAPMALTTAWLVWMGWRMNSLQFNDHFFPSLAGRTLWGLIQQYALQSFIYRRVRLVTTDGESTRPARTRRAIVITACLFALVHAPNLPLMFLTMVAGLVWCSVFERAPNVYALALSHGLLSVVAECSLPDAMIRGMVVGLRHLVYLSF
ncbi:MAG: type II CAAX prenyl endopeptidase Rce1 family protein [Blastocatellia bacterium]